MATSKAAGRTRSLLVKMADGTQKRIHGIPANAKVTFGKVQPGEQGGYRDPQAYALRIYTTQNNQLAVFTNVREFRDLSLTVESRNVETKTRSRKAKDGDGMVREAEEEYEVTTDWEAEE